jgi:hypothetical protein
MFLFFMILALIFLIAGGVGLFYTFVNLTGGEPLWVFGIIVFGTFTIVGLAVLVFLGLFNQEFD